MKSIKHYISIIVHNPKKVIWKADKIFLGSRLKKWRQAKKEQQRLELERFRIEHPEEYYDMMSTANRHQNPIISTQTYSVRDILLAQFVDGECVFYDIAVRILAIEQYYGKNTIGYDLYSRMQAESGTFWLKRFVSLMQSIENRGFQTDNPIEVDEKLTIMDGAHRFALALYHGEEFIPAIMYQTRCERRVNYNWFWEANYSRKEIKQIHQKAIELFNTCKYHYVGVVWPPAFHLRDQIINEINTYLHDGLYPPLQSHDCQVVRSVNLKFKKLDFQGFLRAMYYADCMTEEGIAYKLIRMDNSMPEGCEEYPVCVFYLDVLDPDINRNIKNNTAQSRQIVQIKQAIRNRFKGKVNNYEYDNLLHISDNYIQSKFCDLAVNIDKDVSDLFMQLNKRYDYVIAKAHGRQSEKFPYYYYYYSDMDILARPKDVQDIAGFAEKWLKQKYGDTFGGWVSIDRVLEEIEQIEIQVSLRGWRYFLVHIQTLGHFHMKNDCTEEFLSNRILDEDNPVYILPPKYDMLIRASDLVGKPHKDWHRKYIKQNIADFDEDLAERAFGGNIEYLQKVKHVITSINEQ